MAVVILAYSWWALAVRGALAILFGILAFLWPGISLTALVLLFAAFAFADGVFAIVTGVRGIRGGERWGALLLEGVMGVAVAVLTVLWPAITALALLFLIAIWAIVTGLLEIVAAVRLRQVIRGEWLLALAGVASIVFGGMLILNPGAGALAVLWLIAAYAIVFGALLVGLGFRLRGWLKHAPTVEGLARPA
jgi:uncharacterized membrane protein HdeD (DUF308 family)